MTQFTPAAYAPSPPAARYRAVIVPHDDGAFLQRLKHVPAWLERCLARPAVQRGSQIPKRPA